MKTAVILGLAAVAVAGVGLAFTFQKPSLDTVQNGPRGTGMALVYNRADQVRAIAANQVPTPPPRLPAAGPRAGQVYQNVQVLGDLSIGEFARTMIAITAWIAPPEQGCNYCHIAGNFASEEVYTKGVSRRMLQMTAHINEQWTSHVAATGVTCYTCHRGQPVPAYVWATEPPPRPGFMQTPGLQNVAAPAVGLASLPSEPFTAFLLEDQNIRLAQQIVGRTPAGAPSVKAAEWTYALMMHMSTSLGVNCAFCHNTRNFAGWDNSPPQRTTSWYGIRMVRDVNLNYIVPLTPVWAANPNGPAAGPHQARLGVSGDALKVNCTTCHQGAYKPLLGVPMLDDYPELRRVNTTVVIR